MADIFERLNRGRLQQGREALEQQRRNTNPISRWAQECIDNNVIELDRGPYGVAMRFSLGTRIVTKNSLQLVRFVLQTPGRAPPEQSSVRHGMYQDVRPAPARRGRKKAAARL